MDVTSGNEMNDCETDRLSRKCVRKWVVILVWKSYEVRKDEIGINVQVQQTKKT